MDVVAAMYLAITEVLLACGLSSCYSFVAVVATHLVATDATMVVTTTAAVSGLSSFSSCSVATAAAYSVATTTAVAAVDATLTAVATNCATTYGRRGFPFAVRYISCNTTTYAGTNHTHIYAFSSI